MAYEDPRDRKRDTEDDENQAQEREKDDKSEQDKKDDGFRYTDWASI